VYELELSAGPINEWNRGTKSWRLGAAKEDSSQGSSAKEDSKPESSMVRGNILGVVSISSSPIPSSSVSCCAGWESEDWRYGRDRGFFQCQCFMMHNRFQRV
jgi:hypothetical protein